jgi:hypothetical protein
MRQTERETMSSLNRAVCDYVLLKTALSTNDEVTIELSDMADLQPNPDTGRISVENLEAANEIKKLVSNQLKVLARMWHLERLDDGSFVEIIHCPNHNTMWTFKPTKKFNAILRQYRKEN